MPVYSGPLCRVHQQGGLSTLGRHLRWATWLAMVAAGEGAADWDRLVDGGDGTSAGGFVRRNDERWKPCGGWR